MRKEEISLGEHGNYDTDALDAKYNEINSGHMCEIKFRTSSFSLAMWGLSFPLHLF